MVEIGAYEAKTKWSELLDRVSKGERIAITKHGVRVAVVSPPTDKSDVSDVIAKIRELQKRNTLDGLSIREMIEEGRRY